MIQASDCLEMEIRWLFKIVVSDSRRGMFPAFTDDYGCRIGPETRNWTQMRSAVVKIIENQGRCTWERRGAGDSKSIQNFPYPIFPTPFFLPQFLQRIFQVFRFFFKATGYEKRQMDPDPAPKTAPA